MAISTKNGVEGKVCSHCSKWKELYKFPNDASKGTSQGGKHCVCKECHKQKRDNKRN